MNPASLAVIASLLWVGGLGVGVTLSGTLDDALRSQVQEQLARKAEPALVAPPALKAKPEPSVEDRYWQGLEADAKARGLRAPSKRKMKASQSYRRWFSGTKTLRMNRKLRKGSLELRVSSQRVRFKRQGTLVKSRHTVLTLRNRGSKPLAYRFDAWAKDRGRCKVKGIRQHNAVAILPKQSVDITICAGKSAVKLKGLETLELNPIGYHYLSQVPPTALGVPTARAQAHVVPKGGRSCSRLDNGQLAKALRGAKVRWADLVDYYSRHNCETFRMPEGYRRPRRSLKRLPITGEG